MSIATELQNYADGLDDAYDAVNDMSGIIPQHKNMDNLDQAIRTIPQSQGTTYTAGTGIDIDANNEISVDNTTVPFFSDLATVATTGDYGDLLNTPTIPTVPTNTSDLTNDGDDGVHPFLATDDVATVATTGAYSDLTGTPSLATVATSGDYDDLINKPTIPAAQVQADWNQTTSSAVDYIKNKPGIKNATAATHTDYNNNQDYLPNMRFLSFWNGAYNSGGSSNLVNLGTNAVKTANIKDANVTKAKMAAIPSPDPSTVTTNWGSITASGNNEKTISADGFVVGKGCTFGSDQSALVRLNGQEVGGISYTTFSGYMQVSYCFPVKSGDKVQFYLNKSGPQHQGCKLIGWKM